ncbi:amidohydrolase family protein [bacterium]|nr:amidohydrolase family protein [bacterium]
MIIKLYRILLIRSITTTFLSGEANRLGKFMSMVGVGIGFFNKYNWPSILFLQRRYVQNTIASGRTIERSLFAVCLFFCITPTNAFADLIIRNVTVISPELLEPQLKQTVSIRNDRIVSISNTQSTDQDNTSESGADIVVDGTGRYLIPGLMDSHLHTSVIPGLGFEGSRQIKTHPDMHSAYVEQFPKSLLYYGITQFVDPAPVMAGLERVKSTPLHPDVFHCGPVIARGGYPMNELGPYALMNQFPYLIEPGDSFAAAKVEQTPQSIVKNMQANGDICIKLFFENGFGPRNDLPLPSQAAFKKLIAAAREAGLIVVGHANAFDMQQLAVDAGVDVLGHGVWNWGFHRSASGLPEPIARHLDTVIDRKISYQPTLRVIDGIQALFDPNTLDDPHLEHVVAPTLLNWYRNPEAQWFKATLLEDEVELGGLPDNVIHRIMAEVANKGERALNYLVEQGHPVLLASDHPAHPGHANHPGYSSYLELTHLAKLGIPLDKILAGATLNNAQAFGLSNDYGTVEVGKLANLLLLTVNPLETVEAYNQIETIILHGQAIARESLSASVAK